MKEDFSSTGPKKKVFFPSNRKKMRVKGLDPKSPDRRNQPTKHFIDAEEVATDMKSMTGWPGIYKLLKNEGKFLIYRPKEKVVFSVQSEKK